MKMAIHWEYYSAGQKEEVVITPTQEQKQDIKEKRAEEQDRNIKRIIGAKEQRMQIHGKLNLAVG